MASDIDATSDSFQYEAWLRARYDRDGASRLGSMSVAWRNLNVHGYGAATDYQKTFINYPGAIASSIVSTFTRTAASRISILEGFDGEVNNGEMLLVLGRPGSGCSTFLKTIAGQTKGFRVGSESNINYQGIDDRTMHSEFRGECTYHAESDVHLAHLTVNETLVLPAKARASREDVATSGKSSTAYASETQAATLAALNLRNVVDTKIGDGALVPGISGGERKRVGIAEIMVGESVLQCWDNSTRGLDSANALEFLIALRHSTNARSSAAFVTLYQASQEMYNMFDKVILLYEGREIFFGPAAEAKSYFTKMGFICSERTTTGDFLTSLTNPIARSAVVGSQAWSLRSAEDFAEVWKLSSERHLLIQYIDAYNNTFPLHSKHLEEFRAHRMAQKASHTMQASPYTTSFSKQIELCLVRGVQRLRNDLQTPLSAIGGNCVLSIVLGSMFYNMPETTDSFFGRSVLLFFTILLNTFLGSFEGVGLWDTRPVVEKHFHLALYHPAVESIASMLCDIPNKFLLTFAFNIPFYFLANLRRTPSAFFVFYLFAFVSLVAGSMVFRTIGAMSRTLTASIAPGAVFIGALVIYTGFVLPIPNMHPWFSWIRYIDPIAYAFESLMINEFHGRQFECARFVPAGPSYVAVAPWERMCDSVGAVTGSSVVEGTVYLATAFQFYPEHEWRNLGIIIAMATFLCAVYLAASEWIPLQGSKGEVLLFPRGHKALKAAVGDEESQISKDRVSMAVEVHEKSTPITFNPPEASTPFLWDHLTYDVKTPKGPKRLLDGIQGWAKQGTLTAVMGSSGAGKTTLLNVLANRAPTGTIGGNIVKGNHEEGEHSFARKVGYAQQADIHLPTSTVREALEFSATLRQSEKYSLNEKMAYVNEVIRLLDMGDFVDAVVGVPGQGLNVEQRKKVTIGVELAVRPELLLFLDEPTSGLDSNTAWAICKLLRTLARNGQAILCTIHQPSGDLFQMFDKLLLLSQDGKQAYFGDIGPNCETVINYFHGNGARKCHERENPAEWLLEVTKHNTDDAPDWADKWIASKEREDVQSQMQNMKEVALTTPPTQEINQIGRTEFARGFFTQLSVLTKRNLLRDWRTPSYLYSKSLLVIAAGMVNGFSFWRSDNSLQGVQNQIFSCFLLLTLFSNVVQLIMPQYIGNRDLYEVRERPSKIYSWPAFVLSNTLAELPWQTILGVLLFVVWYYPIGMDRSMAADEVNERSGLVFLFIWSFMIFTSTFSHLVITTLPNAALGVNIASLFYSLSLIFCGVLVSPSALPGFWIWLLRVTPLTYFVGGIVSTGIGHTPILCSAKEMVHFDPPAAKDCATYLTEYITYAGGSLLNPNATQNCQFCPVSNTDNVLAVLGIKFEDRWRDFGLTLVYSAINVLGALALYWLFRLPKKMKT